MALNLSPEQGVKLTKKDRVHVAKKIKQGWKATCLIPDYGFDKNGDITPMQIDVKIATLDMRNCFFNRLSSIDRHPFCKKSSAGLRGYIIELQHLYK